MRRHLLPAGASLLLLGLLIWSLASSASGPTPPRASGTRETDVRHAPGLQASNAPPPRADAHEIQVDERDIVEFVAVAADPTDTVQGAEIVVSGPVPQPWKTTAHTGDRCVLAFEPRASRSDAIQVSWSGPGLMGGRRKLVDLLPTAERSEQGRRILLPVAPARAHDIRIRVQDARNGRPVPGAALCRRERGKGRDSWPALEGADANGVIEALWPKGASRRAVLSADGYLSVPVMIPAFAADLGTVRLHSAAWYAALEVKAVTMSMRAPHVWVIRTGPAPGSPAFAELVDGTPMEAIEEASRARAGFHIGPWKAVAPLALRMLIPGTYRVFVRDREAGDHIAQRELTLEPGSGEVVELKPAAGAIVQLVGDDLEGASFYLRPEDASELPVGGFSRSTTLRGSFPGTYVADVRRRSGSRTFVPGVVVPSSGVVQVAVPPEGAVARVSGRVRFEGRGGVPLSGARVQVVGTQAESRTDNLGRFRFDGISPGRYLLRVFVDGKLHQIRPRHLEVSADVADQDAGVILVAP